MHGSQRATECKLIYSLFQILYGTTENSPLTFLGFPQDNDELKLNTVGCILHHTEVCFSLHPSTSNSQSRFKSRGYIHPEEVTSPLKDITKTPFQAHTSKGSLWRSITSTCWELGRRGKIPVQFVLFSTQNFFFCITITQCLNVCLKAKVVDPNTGQIVPLGTSGELMIRGYCVMLGYWQDPEKTREVISEDRWYKTG